MLSERSGSCRCFLPNSSTSVCEVGAWLLSWVFFLCLGGKERKGKKKAKVEEGASRKAFVGLHTEYGRRGGGDDGQGVHCNWPSVYDFEAMEAGGMRHLDSHRSGVAMSW